MSNLAGYYSSKGKPLPSLAERAKTYENLGLGSAASYRGTPAQNATLLWKLKERGKDVLNSSLASEAGNNAPIFLQTYDGLNVLLEKIRTLFFPNVVNSPSQPCPKQRSNQKIPKPTPSSSAPGGSINYDEMYAPKGKGYRDDQIASYSHYNVPIERTEGRIAGNSRIHGDASDETQRASIDLIVREVKSRGLSDGDAAYVLSMAYIESGFNPDAAAGTTSASGLGQFIDKTGAHYGLGSNNRFDAEANAGALVDAYEDAKKWAEKNHPNDVDVYIYAYHHDGPSLKYGGVDLAREEVIPRADMFLKALNPNMSVLP
ncbi:MAG: lytic transglycosylase domain-containing protein [Verrucomicrobiaceae bacterium]|nr:MAG: lytic transglycosylase domain-containing protein [Verrucomicrobiaceae bacterium]